MIRWMGAGMAGLMVLVLVGCVTVEEHQELQEQLEAQESQLSDLRRERNNLRDERDRLRERVEELEQQEQRVEELQSELSQLERELREVEEADIAREGENVVITLGERILFDTARAELREDAHETLNRLAEIIVQHPEREIRIEGHADSRAYVGNRFQDNLDLAANRAMTVFRHFMDETDLEPDRMGATTFGEFKPLVPNTSPANMQKNRRVEIVLYPPSLPEDVEEP